jgi:hypothetical protein
MAAYLTWTIIGRISRTRHGSDEVQILVRSIQRPDEQTAEWLLREKYPSAVVTNVVANAAHEYEPITAASLATTPVRRHRSHKRRAS